MKKKILMALSMLAVAAVAVGGTVAYYTAADDSAVTFTTGNVAIELNDELDGETIKLMPNNNEKAAPNYTITNTGDENAYVWLKVSVPKELAAETAADNVIHWNIPGAYWYGYHTTAKYYQSVGLDAPVADEDTWKVQDTVVEGDYEVTYLLYTGAIEPDEETNIGVSYVYLDQRVDKIDGKYVMVKNGVVEVLDGVDLTETTIKVEAYGIQENKFTSVEEAFAAFQAQYPEGRPTSFEE